MPSAAKARWHRESLASVARTTAWGACRKNDCTVGDGSADATGLGMMCHAPSLTITVALSSLLPATGLAEPPERSWYGGTTLGAAGASFGLIVLGAGTESAPLVTVGATTWVLAPATIHFAHGNVGRGFLSLGLAAGAPLLLGAMSSAVFGPAFEREGCNDLDCSGFIPAFTTGALAGFVAAPLVDALVLAWDEPEPEAPGGFRPTLTLSPTEGGGIFGLAWTN
jgi:hypothetical protein